MAIFNGKNYWQIHWQNSAGKNPLAGVYIRQLQGKIAKLS
jgi:hypothetical protein